MISSVSPNLSKSSHLVRASSTGVAFFGSPGAMPFDKVRIRFCKSGDLRFVSHLDLMRAFERLLRRAKLPFRMTEGFHPTPRLVLAQSLSLGTIGLSEVLELELTETIEPDEVLRRLREHVIPGINFLSATRILLKTTARPRRASYRIEADGFSDQLTNRIDCFLLATEVWAERERPKPRQVNIRPYVDSLWHDERSLFANTWITQEGTVRADEIARAVGLETVITIERVTLELLDEVPAEEAARTPKIEPQTRPWKPVLPPKPLPSVPKETWGATANGPIVE